MDKGYGLARLGRPRSVARPKNCVGVVDKASTNDDGLRWPAPANGQPEEAEHPSALGTDDAAVWIALHRAGAGPQTDVRRSSDGDST